eukprot:NODE_17_length_41373_cov_0.337016.p25 type:complete len:143 gc:universal NODE_17_length_41373_cov_0.337016:33784-34212(+)
MSQISRTIQYINAAVQVTCWASLFIQNIASPVLAKGNSMRPALPDFSIVVVSRLSKCKMGDIVACKSPIDANKYLCKRIAGVEGSNITVEATGHLFKVPKNCYFLLGDNASTSSDSRVFGPVPSHLVVGRVILMLYPDFRWL